MPGAVTRKLQDELARIVALPDVTERIRALSVEPSAIGSQELARSVAANIARWKRW